MSHSLLETTCPAHSVTLERVVFWTIGYGGWLGIVFLPMLWSLPVSRTIKTMLSVLTPPMCALALTAAFALFYAVSVFIYYTGSIMISPQFLQSCIGIVCLSIGSIGLFLTNGTRMKIELQLKADNENVGSSGSENTDEENVGSSGSDEEVSEEEEVSDEEDVGSSGSEDTDEEVSEEEEVSDEEVIETESDASSVTIAPWDEKPNFEPLRNAPALPE